MGKRIKRWLCMAMCLALTVCLTGCFLLPEEEVALAPPLIEPEEVTYKTVEVERGDIVYSLSFTGYFVSLVSENVYVTHNAGKIKDIPVHSGQEVQEGDILLEFDTDDILKDIRDQELNVEKLQYALDVARQESNDNDIRIAQINLELAQSELDRLQYERDGYVMEYIDSYEGPDEETLGEMDEKIYEQELAVEKLELTLENVQNASNGSAVKNAEYNLQAAQYKLDDLYAAYENAVLRAPISGKLTWMKEMNVGGTVSTYTTLFTISDPSQLVLQYDNSKASQLPVGLEVSVEYEKKTYTGSVTTNPSTNPLSETGDTLDYARFEVDGLDLSQVSQGASAKVTAVLDTREDVIVVNTSYVNNYLGRKYVNVLIDGLKVERDVELGLETATQVEILSGLEEGELLIIG